MRSLESASRLLGADVQALRRGVAPDEGRLRWWVERLAVPRHIFANASKNAWVREELAAAFERCDLSVQIQGRHQNVVALPRCGTGSPVTFVAAHPAVLWTDTGNFRNPHYHCATDTPDTLDYSFMREVAELLCAVVSKEATK